MKKTNKMKYLVSCLAIANLLFLAGFVSAESTFVVTPLGDLGPNRFFEYKGSFNVTCNVSSTPPTNDYNLKWVKDGSDVTSIAELKDRIKHEDKNGIHSLRINKPTDSDIGSYTCVVLVDNKPVVNSTVYAIGKGIVKTPSNVNVIEGEKLRIHCQVLGKPIIQWEVGNTTYNGSEPETSRIQLQKDEEKDMPNAILVIKNIEMSDRGSYKCMAINSVTGEEESYSESYIRVKDKLAALWPFLGICAEVVILCAIILIYEKKRNKQELEESDTDQSPDQKNTPDHGKDTDVRHRK